MEKLTLATIIMFNVALWCSLFAIAQQLDPTQTIRNYIYLVMGSGASTIIITKIIRD